MTRSLLLRWRRVAALTRKELLQLRRDKIMLFFILYAFSFNIYISGTGMGMQLEHAKLGVRDLDRTETSRELISRFQEPYFTKVPVEDPRLAEEQLDQGPLMMLLEIPPDFQTSLKRGLGGELLLQIDTTNSVLGLLGYGYSAQIVQNYGMELALSDMHQTVEALENLPTIKQESRVWYNPNQNDSWFISLSEMLNLITLWAILLPASAMAREKERGTIEQLLVTPLSTVEIMLPKILSMVVVVLGGTTFTLFFMINGVFGLPMRGSLLFFYLVTTLHVLTTSGLGLLLATVARNLSQVAMLTLVTFVPMLLLSGVWTPPEAMPWWMRLLTQLSPLHHYVETSFGILLKGATPQMLAPSCLYLVVLGTAILGVGTSRFRRQFD